MKIRYIWLLGLVLSLHACKTKDKNKTYEVLSCSNAQRGLCIAFKYVDNKTNFSQEEYDEAKKDCPKKDLSVVNSSDCDPSKFTHMCRSNHTNKVYQFAYGKRSTLESDSQFCHLGNQIIELSTYSCVESAVFCYQVRDIHKLLTPAQRHGKLNRANCPLILPWPCYNDIYTHKCRNRDPITDPKHPGLEFEYIQYFILNNQTDIASEKTKCEDANVNLGEGVFETI